MDSAIKSDTQVDTINAAARQAAGSTADFFRYCSLRRSDSGCAELCFLRNTLFYYALLCECGAKPVRFCVNQSQFKTLVPFDAGAALKIIHALRTLAAHSLEDSSNDSRIRIIARAWFRQHTRGDFPTKQEHWTVCAEQIEILGISILRGIDQFVHSLETDPEMTSMKTELCQAIEGGLRRVDIEDIAFQVLMDHGRTDISPGAFCERWLSDWTKNLAIKSVNCDLRREARLLIERTLQSVPAAPPLTASEVMKHLGIGPGPYVGQVMKELNRLFQAGTKDREKLLSLLVDFHSVQCSKKTLN